MKTDPMAKLVELGQYMVLSIFIGLASFAIVSSWRSRPQYLMAAVIFGSAFGFGVGEVSHWQQFSTLATIFGTIMGPAIITWIQGRNPKEVVDELRDIVAGKSSPDTGPKEKEER